MMESFWVEINRMRHLQSISPNTPMSGVEDQACPGRKGVLQEARILINKPRNQWSILDLHVTYLSYCCFFLDKSTFFL